MGKAKLIVASVRLPVTLTRTASRGRKGAQVAERWRVEESPGGLATAMRAVAAEREFVWVGYPGAEVAKSDRPAVRELVGQHGANIPVFADRAAFNGFYGEISNRVLWPLFHAMAGPRRFPSEAWSHYRALNEAFAAAIAEVAEPGDTIWVHDYQLTLVSQLLRAREMECAIGFFLHIPFPSSEIYRALPVREEILSGMLGADLLGFHSYEYVSHFRTACLRVLGIESEPEQIHMPSHDARLGVLPIGIDAKSYAATAAGPEAQRQYDELKATYRGKKVILGVDRLDYTKGLAQKLYGFEEFLRRHPGLRDRVVFIQIAAPSRTDVEEYQSLTRELNELAGRINATYGTLHDSPLHYINQNVPRDRLAALYRLADVALVTPLRDGMNLVCLEYVAARGDAPGTLILSEFAGAASCLSGARIVNPYNTTQIADQLAAALNAEPDAQAFVQMREFVERNTAMRWARRFLDRLEASFREGRGRVERLRVSQGKAHALIARCQRPLILLDYDGTLRPHDPVLAAARPDDRVRQLLIDLARFGVVYIISGRPGVVLDDWLGDLPLGLVCEHGLAIRHLGGNWSNLAQLDTSMLTETVEPVLREFSERTPGSFVELKRASLAWHYRSADPKLGAWRAKELRTMLEGLLAQQPYSVLSGSKVVEIRHVQMSKGRAAQAVLERHRGVDAVICAGNDRTDEEMFEVILRIAHKPHLICRVGDIDTAAPYVVPSVEAMLSELEAMAEIWRSERPV